MYQSCPHGVVAGQCMTCLGEHRGLSGQMLAQIRTWRLLPPAPASLREEETMARKPILDDSEGDEWMTHPCAHCGTPLSDAPGPDGWPYAYCHECQETQRCQHGVLYKDVCTGCDTLSDVAYDTWRERQ